jgi:C-terminal processing protease CtpA/Prc
METLIIQVDCRQYIQDGPPQLGITVEAPFSQRSALQQKQHNNHQDYKNLDALELNDEKPSNSFPYNGQHTIDNHRQSHHKTQQVQQGLKITQIQKNSVIDRVGKFKVGDIIVEVNGVSLQRPFPEAQRTLKQYVVDQTGHGPLVLKVLRMTDSASSRTSRHLVGALNSRRIGVKHRIKLRKTVDGFGIKIAERDNMHNTKSRPIFVTAITTAGSAYQDGRLREGDMLLEVNGVDLRDKTQPEVTRMLKSVKINEEVEFVISRQEDLPSNDTEEIHNNLNTTPDKETSTENNCDKSLIDLTTPGQDDSLSVESISHTHTENKIDNFDNTDESGTYIFDIPLNDTKSAGLGLYLKYPCRTDDRRDLGIWIEKVITGGAAWKDGRLRPDDRILAINGIDLVGLSNAEASETLTAAVCRGIGPEATLNTIRLRIHRPSDENVESTDCDIHFQRDGFGRQSISEKRHAQLNAKNTDTFRRNQKIIKEREQQRLLEEEMARQRLLEEQMARQSLTDEKMVSLDSPSENIRLLRSDSFRAAVLDQRPYEVNTNGLCVRHEQPPQQNCQQYYEREVVSVNLNTNDSVSQVISHDANNKKSSLISKFLKLGSIKRKKNEKRDKLWVK